MIPIEKVKTISINVNKVIERMKAGEKLRWVPCKMLDVKAPCRSQRMLMLGCDVLDDESGLAVVALERKHVLECSNEFVSEYELRSFDYSSAKQDAKLLNPSVLVCKPEEREAAMRLLSEQDAGEPGAKGFDVPK